MLFVTNSITYFDKLYPNHREHSAAKPQPNEPLICDWFDAKIAKGAGFFAHRRLPIGKKIKILRALGVSVVKKYYCQYVIVIANRSTKE